ncbi:MAG: DUF523 and DUF1722 domain-containing protein [Syntrophorhabdaceae bacterium]|nr:DUF523 and DUF1722 domain-containing protein [Syntrophorhabdaceae bacterium]
MEKIKVGISRCLLGEKVRYDGGHQHDRYLTDTLGRYFDYVPVCPEVEYGLPVPREAMRLVGSPEDPRLLTIKTGIDHTDGMKRWADTRLKELEKEGLCGFIFKSKSPSSGMQGVKVYSSGGMPVKKGTGIFAGAFMRHFPLLPVEDDGRLNDPVIRENFIERIFVYKRWQGFIERGGEHKDLVAFHTDHKYLIMSHSPKHLTELGRIVADSRVKNHERNSIYVKTMMDGLKFTATRRKNTNCLHHIMGYFKKDLTGDEKQELLEVIEDYHKGIIPLIVPITLIKHYVRKYDKPYLKRQAYLNPHPMELMLRNHG